MKKIKLVGEIGINHNGDMEIAKQLVDVAKVAGLDYVKFQKRDIDSVYTKEFLDGPRESPWGKTQRDQKEGIEFDFSDYLQLDKYIEGSLQGWFASPWDVKSVKLLQSFNCPYMKVASASICDFELLEAIKSTNIPVIVSTGMSTKEEVDACVNLFGDQIEYLLSCKSTYPTKDKDMNLNFIQTLKNEYPQYRIGFSNHNAGIQGCLAASVLGAEMVEFHITLGRAMYGSDQAASIETKGIMILGHHTRGIEEMMGTGDWVITPEELEIKKKLRG